MNILDRTIDLWRDNPKYQYNITFRIPHIIKVTIISSLFFLCICSGIILRDFITKPLFTAIYHSIVLSDDDTYTAWQKPVIGKCGVYIKTRDGEKLQAD